MNSEINQRVISISLVIIASIMAAGALYWLEPVMVPLVLAIMITYMLAPIVDTLVGKLRFPRSLAVAVAMGLAGFTIFLVGGMISNSVKTLAIKAPIYEKHIREKAESVVDWIEYKEYDVETDDLVNRIDEIPIASMLAGATNTLLDLITNTFLILIFVIYLLQGRDPEKQKGAIALQIEQRIKHYLVIKLVLSLATGVLTAIILSALHVELAMVFGVLAFILNFVPNVGSIAATVMPIPVILLDPNFDPMILLLAVGLPGSIQMIVGNVIEPKMLGDSLELHPITVLLSLIFWGMLWGIPGMLLAAPITAVLKILSEHLEITAPVARLLAGDLGIKKRDDESLQAPSSPGQTEDAAAAPPKVNAAVDVSTPVDDDLTQEVTQG